VAVVDDEIRLGPESMGSFPGPACYGLGGEKPTLTDAFVAAGLIDPQFFLGGARQLDLEQARQAMDDGVARRKGMSIDEACRMVVERAHGMVAGVIECAGRELRKNLSDHVLFAYGGNGGLFACGVAERAGMDRVYLFSLGPVFSAFGSSVSDLSHMYERSLRVSLGDADISGLNGAIDEMRAAALRDLKAEGIGGEDAEYSLELEFSGAAHPVKSTILRFESVDELRRLAGGNGDRNLELVRMWVRKKMARPVLVEESSGAEDAFHAKTGTRTVTYGSDDAKASVYKWELLKPGNQVAGCALLVSGNSTYFVPQGWNLTMDRYGNAVLTREKSGGRPQSAREWPGSRGGPGG